MLKLGSRVRLTLCRGQGGTPADQLVRPRADTWQAMDMAAPGGFVLRSVHPFCPPEGYTPRGYRGGAKGFHIEGALTHVFYLVGSAVAALPSAASLQTGRNLVASRLRSLMGASENPLGITVRHLARALGVDSSRIISSWASDGGCVAAAHWRCRRAVSLVACSPVQPPFGHILDITLDELGRSAFRTILRDTGGGGAFSCTSFNPATVSWDSADSLGMATTASWRIYCRRLHVATLWCPQSNSDDRLSSSYPLIILGDTSSFEKNGCSLIATTGTSDEVLSNASLDPGYLLDIKMFEAVRSELSSVADLARLQLSIHVELLALASGCLDDWRLLLSELGQESGPLYPGTLYTHDLSLWLDEGCDEQVLLTSIHNATGELLQRTRLVDDYRDPSTGRRSRCYRLVYQSLWKALSREAARDFHLALGAALSDLLPVQVK